MLSTQPGKPCFFHGSVQPIDWKIPLVSPCHQGQGSQTQSLADSQQPLGWNLPKPTEFLRERDGHHQGCCLLSKLSELLGGVVAATTAVASDKRAP